MVEIRKTWTLEEARNIDFDNYSKIVQRFEPRDYGRENQPFAFPGPLARNISQNSTKIKRGFMRSIILGGDVANKLTPGKTAGSTTAPGNIRLNFQFNPEYIERRVSQSPGAVNPLLQNPQNLTQAVPGTAVFNFTMLFNREAEVAAQRKRFVRSDGTIEEPLNFNLFAGEDFNEQSLEDALKDPGKVGVMHDLNLFDKIIGQGITSELVDTITRYTQQQVIAINNNIDNETDEDKKKRIEFEQDQQTAFSSSINKNFGNSAFLNPMPVRIVFSDLFMVEGLIVGSAVAFQKFNQDMIPTICQVNCELMALYVGFAKRKAFLSDNLTDWATTQANNAQDNANAVNKAKAEMLRRIRGVKVVFNSSESVNQRNNDDNALSAPGFNEVGMRVLRPTITSSFYPGNNSTFDTRYVTVPQWYNAFTGTHFYPTIGTDVSQQVLGQFTQQQNASSSKEVGKLPIAVFIEYNNLTTTRTQKGPTGNQQTITTKTPLDANFDITWQLRDDSTGLKKTLKARKENGEWKEENYPEVGIKEINDTYTLYKNVYYVDPEDVPNKQAIKSSAKCTFILTITMKQNIQGINGEISLTFKPIEIPFQSTEPLYYSPQAANVQHAPLVKSLKVFDPKGGPGGGLKTS